MPQLNLQPRAIVPNAIPSHERDHNSDNRSEGDPQNSGIDEVGDQPQPETGIRHERGRWDRSCRRRERFRRAGGRFGKRGSGLRCIRFYSGRGSFDRVPASAAESRAFGESIPATGTVHSDLFMRISTAQAFFVTRQPARISCSACFFCVNPAIRYPTPNRIVERIFPK